MFVLQGVGVLFIYRFQWNNVLHLRVVYVCTRALCTGHLEIGIFSFVTYTFYNHVRSTYWCHVRIVNMLMNII